MNQLILNKRNGFPHSEEVREGSQKIKIFKQDFIYLFLERGGSKGEKEGEKHQCVVAFHVPPN